MTPLVIPMCGAPLAALAASAPPVARVVAAMPAMTTAVRRAFLTFLVLDMVGSPRSPVGQVSAAPLPMRRILGRLGTSEADSGPPRSHGQTCSRPGTSEAALWPPHSG